MLEVRELKKLYPQKNGKAVELSRRPARCMRWMASSFTLNEKEIFRIIGKADAESPRWAGC